MFDYQQQADDGGRASEAKVWSVLVSQIWAGLVGYCYGGGDISKALTPEFSQLLSQLLYSQDELRPAVLKALKTLVESNAAFTSASDTDRKLMRFGATASAAARAQAPANVAFLRSQAESWLAVLFNVFSTVDRGARALVGDVVTAWLGIAGAAEVAKAHTKVIALFQQHLASSAGTPAGQGEGSVAATTLDLLALLTPFISATDATALFHMCLSTEVLASKDVGVQKRGYKILARLAQGGVVPVDAEAVVKELEVTGEALHAAAKKDRFALLAAIVPAIPPASLHIMPTLIPEAILGTKEPAEKARTAAFDLLVVMGRKMAEGGVVKRAQMDGMDDGGETKEAPASMEEYMTMIAGGLAGATPHMISATVTAISRVVFEFKGM
jgi:ribosomal RNA-processing protein 12